MQIKIGEINIIYSANQQFDMEKIKSIIEKNYELILSCFDENKIIDISDNLFNFNDFFTELVNVVFKDEKNKKLFDSEDFNTTLYLEWLTRNKAKNDSSIEIKSNVNDEILFTIITYKYFMANKSFDEFIEYLKHRDNDKEIIEWLRKTTRWDAYNQLLKSTSECLRTDNEEFFKQMNYIVCMWLDRCAQKFGEDFDTKYQKITEKEFDDLVYGFLNFINAPVEWVNMYDNLKENNYIIVTNNNEEDDSMCFKDTDGKYKIKIRSKNDLKDFCTFIHELIHYISRNNGLPIEKITVSELPSIYFEKISAIFLKEKGYSSDIVDKIISDRENNNFYLCMSMLPLFNDLIRFINFGEIKRKDKIDFYQKQIDAANRLRKGLLRIIEANGQSDYDLKRLTEIKIDVEKEIDDECDLFIDKFIDNGLLIIDGYQYLLDSYLVEQILGKQNDKTTEKMIGVTNNLGSTSIKDILKVFDIEKVLKHNN